MTEHVEGQPEQDRSFGFETRQAYFNLQEARQTPLIRRFLRRFRRRFLGGEQ